MYHIPGLLTTETVYSLLPQSDITLLVHIGHFFVCSLQFSVYDFIRHNIISVPVEDNPSDYEVSDQHIKSTGTAYHRSEQILHETTRRASQSNKQHLFAISLISFSIP